MSASRPASRRRLCADTSPRLGLQSGCCVGCRTSGMRVRRTWGQTRAHRRSGRLSSVGREAGTPRPVPRPPAACGAWRRRESGALRLSAGAPRSPERPRRMPGLVPALSAREPRRSSWRPETPASQEPSAVGSLLPHGVFGPVGLACPLTRAVPRMSHPLLGVGWQHHQ